MLTTTTTIFEAITSRLGLVRLNRETRWSGKARVEDIEQVVADAHMRCRTLGRTLKSWETHDGEDIIALYYEPPTGNVWATRELPAPKPVRVPVFL